MCFGVVLFLNDLHFPAALSAICLPILGVPTCTPHSFAYTFLKICHSGFRVVGVVVVSQR